jgi:hypothetical protein
MADAGTFATTAAIAAKAGANANATSVAAAWTDIQILECEAEINCATRYNWSDAYAALNADVKHILSEAASNLCAIYVIQYDMSGFTSRGEAESMITILRDGYLRCLQFLRDKNTETFMNGA